MASPVTTRAEKVKRLEAFWDRVEKGGLTFDDLQLPVDDPEMRSRLIRNWKAGAPDSTSVIPQEQAIPVDPSAWRFDLEDWRTYYAVAPQSIAQPVPPFPWGDAILDGPCPFHTRKTVRETHFAFLGLEAIEKPLTIMRWRELHPCMGQPRFYSKDPWYAGEPFATEVTCRFQWYLLLREIIPGSTSNAYADQEHMLPAEYEVPFAIAEVTKDILYYRKTGLYLNKTVYARSQDKGSGGRRVRAGRFVAGGLRVSDGWDGGPGPGVGLGASRKS